MYSKYEADDGSLVYLCDKHWARLSDAHKLTLVYVEPADQCGACESDVCNRPDLEDEIW